MEKEIIIDKINTFLIDEFEIEEELISPQAALKDTLELDSLDFVDLVVAIDSEFGIKLTSKDFEGVETLGSFYDLIEQKLA